MNTDGERPSRKLLEAHINHKRPKFAVVLMAMGLVFAIAFVFVFREPPPVPVPDATSVSGTYTLTTTRPGATESGEEQVVVDAGSYAAVSSGDAAGSSRRTQPPATSPSAVMPEVRASYSAARRLERTYDTTGGHAGTSVERGAWPPVWRIATDNPLEFQGLSAIARSVVEESDHAISVRQYELDGRRVWRCVLAFPDGAQNIFVVDQLSGLVTWRLLADGHGFSAEFSTTPDWDAPPPTAETLALPTAPAAPRPTSVTRSTSAYVYKDSLAAAGVAARSTPLEPTLLPDGYLLKTSAVAHTRGAPLTWFPADAGRAPANDSSATQPAADEIAQLYTRGLTWLSLQTVTTHGSPAVADLSRQVLKQYVERGLSHESEVLEYGAMKGATAHTWYAPSGPSLFIVNDHYTVYATGSLTRRELLSLAAGLKPLGGAGAASPSATP